MNTVKLKESPLTTRELVNHMLIEDEITLNNTTIDKAIHFLDHTNNYYRIAAYKTLYNKKITRENKEVYIDLDFNYLKELSSIDVSIRHIILKMCSDIEHSLKVKMLHDISHNEIKSSEVVDLFLSNNDNIIKNIERYSSSPYVSRLLKDNFEFIAVEKDEKIYNNISNYRNCPIWVLMELLSFGDFIKCHTLFYEKYDIDSFESNVLNLTKSLRNCCAHNNCFINNLYDKSAYAPKKITDFITGLNLYNSKLINKKLKTRPILEFVTMLYVFNDVVSVSAKKRRYNELNDLFSLEIIRNKNYFLSNRLITSSYHFIYTLIKNLNNSLQS